ncbi:hypothetical protein [Fenollaria timonensis]|uniref:hypothetical protein n=1 Tax=Fenollaria timonensis TaxID=1723384 RepID=UPI00071C308C|nr:hypothetical protein [Fenollaria timonensis]
MKKKLILLMTMLMAVAMLFIGCNKNKTEEPKENTKQEEKTESRDNGEEEMSEEEKKNNEYAELVKRTKGISGLVEGDLVTQYVKIAKAEEDADKLTLLLSYAELAYIYEDHVFTNTAGMQMPLKLVYEKKGDDYELKEKISPEDGEGYEDSLLKMVDGDKNIAQEIASDAMIGSFGEIMKDLYKKAEEAGLKDFTLDLDNVPGYPKDESLFLEDVPNVHKNSIVIVNKEEYEKAKKNEANENWPHVEGLVYDKETKIAIKEIIDNFTK